jgi:hypothetical protein
MSVDMSPSEKIVSGLALAVLLLGLASGPFAGRMGMGRGAAPIVRNDSARHAHGEISPTRRPVDEPYVT